MNIRFSILPLVLITSYVSSIELMIRNDTDQDFCYTAMADTQSINDGPQYLARSGYLGFPDGVTMVELLPRTQCSSEAFVAEGQGPAA